jgi:hypothetical protein
MFGSPQAALEARARDFKLVSTCRTERVVCVEHRRDRSRRVSNVVEIKAAWSIDSHSDNTWAKLDVDYANADLTAGRCNGALEHGFSFARHTASLGR